MRVAWVVVDLQHGFETPELYGLAVRVADAVAVEPGPVWALVQSNPPGGPLGKLRGWYGSTEENAMELLDVISALAPVIIAKTGYGARADLPVEELGTFDAVYVVGMDTDACVLATAFGLFDAGVPVVVRTELCASSGGASMHAAAVTILRRQLGANRVQSHGPGMSH